MKFQSIALAVALGYANCLQSPTPLRHSSLSVATGPILPSRPVGFGPLLASKWDGENQQSSTKRSLLKKVLGRLDTLGAADLEDVKVAGIIDKIKKLHNPKTYLALSLLAGLRWQWCFRSPYYWFGVAFCVKWYRARYVFKIPVWDRQPNWNNIITSKEQEKDLKAYTCLNCGSTIFIAKTREFFFEGDTGIGGLGCFSCGAKGKENFVMDRDRIVEDVAEMDDYFEYERPLDFVSRAERRKILKEAGGDEDKANEILMARSAAQRGEAPPTAEKDMKRDVEGTGAEGVIGAEVETGEGGIEQAKEDPASVSGPVVSKGSEEPAESLPKPETNAEESSKPKKKRKNKKIAAIPDDNSQTAAKDDPPSARSEDLDVLDMDDF